MDLMKKLLIASSNPGKLHEIHALLDDLGITLVTPDDLMISLEVEEDGATYAENASRKALAFARLSGLLTLADDSGLEVDALNGMPGLHSARFSPLPKATDVDRRSYLLDKLKGRSQPWSARFRCMIALATPAGEVQFTEGVCQGEIIPTERGQAGFGYDPIFLIPELGKTMAELTMEEKNRLSHRSRAVQAVRPLLVALLK